MGRGKGRQRARGKLQQWAGVQVSDVYKRGDEDHGSLIERICRIFAKDHPGVEIPDVASIRSKKERKKWRGGSLEEE